MLIGISPSRSDRIGMQRSCVIPNDGDCTSMPRSTCAMPPSTARSHAGDEELSSEARNVTAAAISSGLPLRPIGTWEANPAAACSACRGQARRRLPAGVRVGRAHRIHADFAVFNSSVQAREKLRTAALLAAVDTGNLAALHVRDRRVQDNRTAVLKEKGLLP